MVTEEFNLRVIASHFPEMEVRRYEPASNKRLQNMELHFDHDRYAFIVLDPRRGFYLSFYNRYTDEPVDAEIFDVVELLALIHEHYYKGAHS